MKTKKHIAVLKGGWSAEREVSLASGEACAKALRNLGYKVTEIDVQPDLAQILAEAKPDIVFNALHGRWGEDGCVQGLLEILKIPYTHSGVLASALAMDKPMAKKIFAAAGLRCPEGKVVSRTAMAKGDPMKRPYVVKPANEGSSVGVHIVTEADNRTLEMILGIGCQAAGDGEGKSDPRPPTPDAYLVEQYIPGREVTVAVLNDKPLGVTEIRPKAGFYDYRAKYTVGVADHLCPAPLSQKAYGEAMELALTAHRALGCRGLSRADFRYDDTKKGKEIFYLLEVNTQPGMTRLSLSPELAAHVGIDFTTLVGLLIEGARLGA